MVGSVQVFPVICLALIHLTAGQSSDRFIVDVMSYTRPNLSPRTLRCSGTVISPQHVLTTANCASIPTSEALAIFFRSDGSSSDEVTFTASRTFIHPDYEVAEHRIANVAVIQINGTFNSTMFQPRTLGSLPTNSSCNLFGWGGTSENPRSNSVGVYKSQFCDPNFPLNFCATFYSKTDDSCSSVEGSPLVCFDSTVDGFLIDNVEACTINSDQFLLNFHTVSEYRDWINQQMTGSQTTVLASFFLVLSGFLISVKRFL